MDLVGFVIRICDHNGGNIFQNVGTVSLHHIVLSFKLDTVLIFVGQHNKTFAQVTVTVFTDSL